MRRFSTLVALVMLTALCFDASSALAQRGQGGPGGFGGFGMGRGGGGASQLLGMLRTPEVRKEVNISDEAFKAVEEAQQGNRDKMRNFREMSEDERSKLMEEMNTQAQELLDEVLEPAAMKRLLGLYVQQAGNRAVTNTLIAKEIGLDEAGTKKVGDAVQKAGEEMRSKMEELRGGGGQGGFDREKFGAMMQDAQKKTDEAILAALTDDQKKALEALKGEKFTFPAPDFNFGRGPGGAGGPGAGGGRPRPATDN